MSCNSVRRLRSVHGNSPYTRHIYYSRRIIVQGQRIHYEQPYGQHRFYGVPRRIWVTGRTSHPGSPLTGYLRVVSRCNGIQSRNAGSALILCLADRDMSAEKVIPAGSRTAHRHRPIPAVQGMNDAGVTGYPGLHPVRFTAIFSGCTGLMIFSISPGVPKNRLSPPCRGISSRTGRQWRWRQQYLRGLLTVDMDEHPFPYTPNSLY